jgi:hypothetical protein
MERHSPKNLLLFYHDDLSKNYKLCDLITMHNCHVFLTAVENSYIFRQRVLEVQLFFIVY